MHYLILFLSLIFLPCQSFSEEISSPQSLEFPQPAKSILSKYVKDKEIANSITVDSAQIHWRNAASRVGIKYFSPAELEDLVVTVNATGLLTYKGLPLVPGSYSYILSKEGRLLAFLRKNAEGVNLNQELTTWFQKKAALDPKLLTDTPTKQPLFHKVVCKHSSLSHGDPVLAVGDFEVYDKGVAAFFNNGSGHYRLKAISLKNLALYLQKAGIKDVRFDLFYKTPEKKIRKKISSLLEVLNAADDAPLFVDMP